MNPTGFAGPTPTLWAAAPFGLLLILIAAGPLFFADWWARHHPKAALGLGASVVAYYWLGLGGGARVLDTGFEYLSFICLIGSLFVVSGGIHVDVQGEATPLANCAFLGLGAVLANVLGTTGAAMLLIRPWIRMNKYRFTGHHLAFFIFVVANVGGCLTPIGDPPLFLGYLAGVPFWWMAAQAWPVWLVGVGMLLGLFYAVDLRNFRRAPPAVRASQTAAGEWFRVQGAHNLVFLAVILGAVLWVRHPTGLREGVLVLAAWLSHRTTKPQVHAANQFNFQPIREVAVLFAGIFACMMPALDWLAANAGHFVTPTPALFYAGSGILSSVLDNAPTYLTFLSAAVGASVDPGVAAEVQRLAAAHGGGLSTASAAAQAAYAALAAGHPDWAASGRVTVEQASIFVLLSQPALARSVLAVSVGSVFWGANTYIGNGPNFMVKAIADHAGVRTPNFARYIWQYAIPAMGPMLAATWWLFFRG